MRKQTSEKVVSILLVEDNPADIRLTREAFKECHIKNQIYEVHNGQEALSFLRNETPYEDMPKPSLILLDLNLPKMHGHEVLKVIKSDKKLRRIPVVILTTSQSEDDILESYNAHANCYIPKPVGFEQFLETIQSIEEFWVNTGILPEQ